jgi:NADH/NAD ratio-sensing transcriptional regulator Rex
VKTAVAAEMHRKAGSDRTTKICLVGLDDHHDAIEELDVDQRTKSQTLSQFDPDTRHEKWSWRKTVVKDRFDRSPRNL